MPFAGAALAPKMLAPEKSPGIKFCRQFQKVGARKFIDAITCSYKIVLCQTCKFYHSWCQLWSHDTVVLLLVTSIHVKRVNCYVYYDLFCYTGRFVYFGHFHAEQPEVYLQRVNKEWFWTSVTDCDLSWLTRKYFDSRWYLLFSWLIKCMLSIWRLDLFIKRHVSLTVNIYYSHMRKLILEPCAWICKHPWSDQKIICVFTVTRPTLIFASDPMNFYTEFG